MKLPIHFPDILSLIPQSPPFVFVDTLHRSDNSMALATYLPRPDVPFFADGRVPAEIMLEMMAQTGALQQGYMALLRNNPKPKGFIASIDKARFENLSVLGQTLEIHFHLRSVHGLISVAEAQVYQRGIFLAEAIFKIFCVEGSPF
ncbi:MAG: hypothetical protein N2110_05955 [Flavobacteriales bacterium]|nr:hypothetical protein [Flavobacteriales bacterium]MCX7768548.1 hypothetical protein [Flavobacteriales bacterium]MDW8409483.1 hypothetical protein [Flavobacteriales bacterium]